MDAEGAERAEGRRELPAGTLGGTTDFNEERPRDTLRRGRWNYDDADDAGTAGSGFAVTLALATSQPLCHPERSEGSSSSRPRALDRRMRILRLTPQDDKLRVMDAALGVSGLFRGIRVIVVLL